jgi:hypothetical protein
VIVTDASQPGNDQLNNVLLIAPVIDGILSVRRRAAHLTASAGIANAAVSRHQGVRPRCVAGGVTNVVKARETAIHGGKRP